MTDEEKAMAMILEAARKFVAYTDGKPAPTREHAELRRACQRFLANPNPLDARILIDQSDLVATVRKGAPSA